MAKQGKPRNAGKRAGRIAGYFNDGRLTRKKLRNVIRASGYEEAVRWAKANGAEGMLAGFEKAKNDSGQPLRWLARAKARSNSPT